MGRRGCLRERREPGAYIFKNFECYIYEYERLAALAGCANATGAGSGLPAPLWLASNFAPNKLNSHA
jgi:hypothetical protein